MNHVVIGAALPFCIGVFIFLRNRGRASLRLLTVTPVCMALGALWAIGPDIPRALGIYDAYHEMARDPRANVFFFHYSVDNTETDSILYLAVFVVMVVCLIAAAWRELRRREAGQ